MNLEDDPKRIDMIFGYEQHLKLSQPMPGNPTAVRPERTPRLDVVGTRLVLIRLRDANWKQIGGRLHGGRQEETEA